jgi:hypothetical protein
MTAEGGTPPAPPGKEHPPAATPEEAVGEVRRFDHGGEVRRVAVSPDGRRALAACYDRALHLWSLGDGREVRPYPGHADRVHGVAFLPDGRRALSCSEDHTVRLWDLGTGRPLHVFTGHSQPVHNLAVSPDGRVAASCGPESTILLWDLEAGTELRRLEGREGGVGGLAFAPDGKFLLAGTYRGPLRLWEVATGKEVRRLEGHAGGVHAVALAPGGRYALSGGADRTVRVWSVADGREVRRLEGHAGTVFGVAFSPDGRRAVSCGQDNTVRLWDVPAGKEVKTFEGHVGRVWDVAFCPDGAHVLSGGSDQTVRLWRLPPAPLVAGGPLELEVPAPKPRDPDACLAAGRLACLQKGDWDAGLPLLAAGSDAGLADLARADLRKPLAPGAQLEVGDRWWDRAEGETGQAQAQLRARARFWYRQALPNLTAADRGKVENRLKLVIDGWEGKPGLVAELFADGSLKKKVKGRLDYQVHFDWGLGSPDPAVPVDNFSVRWQGYLHAPRPGRYTLVVDADDGARLFLDDRLVLDAWDRIDRHSASVALDEEPHPLRIEYHEKIGAARMLFRWAPEGGSPEQPVPFEALYHDLKQERALNK